MKLRTTYLLGVFALALAPSLSKAEEACDAAAPALSFEVRAVDSKEVVVETDASSREMNRRSRKASWGGKLLGQTDAAFGARVVTEERSCGRKAVVLEAHLVKQTVHVASDLPKDSCTYRETYEHELEHVAINRQQLLAIQGEFAARVDAARFSSAEDLAKTVTAKVLPALYDRFRDTARLHAQYDDDDKHAPRTAECMRDLAQRTAAL
jgi:hypothetical protein